MRNISEDGRPEQGLPGYEAIFLGLRLVEPILVHLAHANPPPRMVERVLALWGQEPAGPQASFNPTAACDVFAEQPELESAVFTADMRASVRDTPAMAHLVFDVAIMAMLQRVLARPTNVDIGDALALHACKAAESRAEEARVAATAAAAAAAAGSSAFQRAEAAEAWVQALETATVRVEAARAARRGGRAGAPPGGLLCAAYGGDVSDDSDSYSKSSEEAVCECMGCVYGYDSDDMPEYREYMAARAASGG